MAHWFDSYVGLPVTHGGRSREQGVDCWGLARLIYREQLGIELEAFDYPPEKEIEEAIILSEIETEHWKKVESPQEFDLVLFHVPKGGPLCHLGVCLDPWYFVHVTKKGIFRMRHDAMLWTGRREGFYRHVDR